MSSETKKPCKLITLRMSEDEHRRIAQLAEDAHESINLLCLAAIRAYRPDTTNVDRSKRIKGKRSSANVTE